MRRALAVAGVSDAVVVTATRADTALVMQRIMGADEPPAVRAKRLRLYYMAQYGVRPPRFSVHVNDRSLLTRSYGFFLENRLRERYGLEGVPLVIDYKTS